MAATRITIPLKDANNVTRQLNAISLTNGSTSILHLKDNTMSTVLTKSGTTLTTSKIIADANANRIIMLFQNTSDTIKRIIPQRRPRVTT